jgi:NhaA family Na+:H+ antiporter
MQSMTAWNPQPTAAAQCGAKSSYLVLPLFALANARVTIMPDSLMGHEPLMLAIIFGLVIGKPVGLVWASAIAVRLGIATKPGEYSWRQLTGAEACRDRLHHVAVYLKPGLSDSG